MRRSRIYSPKAERGVVGAEDTRPICSPSVCLSYLFLHLSPRCVSDCEAGSRELSLNNQNSARGGCARTRRPSEQGEEPGRGTGQSVIPGHPQREPSQGDKEGRDQEGKNK